MPEQEVEIVLIEDSPDDIELALYALRNNHLANRVHIARDGQEALNYFFEQDGSLTPELARPPKLILLDLKLPKVDGMDVLKALKAHPNTRALPVVVMTSSKEQRDLVEGYKLGVNSYIQKPIDFAEFRQIIKSLGYYWLVINQPPPQGMFRVPKPTGAVEG